jgi:small multidrug resistance pump
VTNTTAWFSLMLSIASSIVGQTLLKAGAMTTPTLRMQLLDLRTLGGMMAYAAAAVLYMISLRRLPMSVALPFAAVSYVAIAIIGYVAFGEALKLAQIGALAVICVGILLLAIAST